MSDELSKPEEESSSLPFQPLGRDLRREDFTPERIRRLEETGVIRQYATLLDHSKVKKGLLAICYVSLKEHNKKSGARFIRTIQQMPEIVECFIISGEFDFLLKVAVENMDAYYDFHVNKLGQVENIGHVQSTFVMGVIKQTHQQIR